jgi:Flp pilus assembly protein TadG
MSDGKHRGRGSEQGSVLIEFGLVVLLLLLLMFGIIDFARALYAYHFVANAAREGTRYSIVRGSSFQGTSCGSSAAECDATSSDVQSYVQGLATGIGISASSLVVNTTWLGTGPSGSDEANGGCDMSNGNSNNPGCLVQVQVQYPFNFILPFMPTRTCPLQITSSQTISANICMSSTSQMVISQ